MPDIGWQELLIIGAIAIIVVGPKDLPLLMRTVGRWVGRARAMAADFQRSMDDLAHETELEKLRRSINEIGNEIGNEVGDEVGAPDLTATDPESTAIHGGVVMPTAAGDDPVPPSVEPQADRQAPAPRSGTGGL